MSTKYYKLGGNASNFWDPTQPEEENKKLTLGQVKPLEQTKAVNERVRAGGLVIVEKSEFDSYQKDLKATKSNVAKSAVEKTVKDANAKTEKAVKAKEAAETELGDVKSTLGEVTAESETKDAELVELRAKVAALEGGDAAPKDEPGPDTGTDKKPK